LYNLDEGRRKKEEVGIQTQLKTGDLVVEVGVLKRILRIDNNFRF
jgi:hypothetical protein